MRFVPVLLGILIVIFDQIMKSSMGEARINNPGIAFGIEVAKPIIILVHLVILLIILVVMIRSRKSVVFKGLLAIIGISSMSGLLDRIRFGGVRDYLQVAGISFNLADIAVVAAIIGLIVLFINERSSNTKKT